MNDHDFNRVNASGEIPNPILARLANSLRNLAGKSLNALKIATAFVVRPTVNQPQRAEAIDTPKGSEIVDLIK